MTSKFFRQYIAGYTVANVWRYPIRCCVTKASALEYTIKADTLGHFVRRIFLVCILDCLGGSSNGTTVPCHKAQECISLDKECSNSERSVVTVCLHSFSIEFTGRLWKFIFRNCMLAVVLKGYLFKHFIFGLNFHVLTSFVYANTKPETPRQILRCSLIHVLQKFIFLFQLCRSSDTFIALCLMG